MEAAARRTRLATSRAAIAAITLATTAILATPGHATRVSSLAAAHRHGQTFLTWTSPAGVGWTYRAYASNLPLDDAGDLAGATLLGAVGDSTWCDRRLSGLRNVVSAFSIDSAAAPLTPVRGLFVATPLATGTRYYAVTAQLGAGSEDTSLLPGTNALAIPVPETMARPRPVYQRTLIQPPFTFEVYTLWTTDVATALFPAMSNRASWPYDHAVVRGGAAPANGLLFRGHGRGGNFLNGLGSTGQAGEWRGAVDDYVSNGDVATSFYGYHEDYDVLAINLPPTTGIVRGVTHARVLFTLDWALANLPVDAQRIYTSGGSMGASFGVFLAAHDPERVAAVWGTVPRADLSFVPDPSGFPRAAFNRMWGDVAATNLPTDEGMPVYDRLNARHLAALNAARGVAPMVMFSGRQDIVVGWNEKPPWFAAMQTHRQGGYFFWDNRPHGGAPGAWSPMEDARYLYRFRRDRSFPALSRCSADHDPGDGDPASGDSVGTINGFVEWDTTIVDQPTKWQVTLSLRSLATRWNTFAAPESCTADITPRRLQRFIVTPGSVYAYRVELASDGAIIQAGVLAPDSLGLLTVPAARIHRTGTRVVIEPLETAAVDPGSIGFGPRIQLSRHPVRDFAMVAAVWPGRGPASLELMDVAGRRVRRLWNSPAAHGSVEVRLDGRGLGGGVYFLVARQGGTIVSRRVVVL